MDLQAKKVDMLKTEVMNAHRILQKLEDELKKEKNMLQSMCSHEDFWADDNGDYHKPGYYYTCKCCGYFTNYRPAKYTRR